MTWSLQKTYKFVCVCRIKWTCGSQVSLSEVTTPRSFSSRTRSKTYISRLRSYICTSAVKTPSNPRGSRGRKSQIPWYPTHYKVSSCTASASSGQGVLLDHLSTKICCVGRQECLWVEIAGFLIEIYCNFDSLSVTYMPLFLTFFVSKANSFQLTLHRE